MMYWKPNDLISKSKSSTWTLTYDVLKDVLIIWQKWNVETWTLTYDVLKESCVK